MKLAILLFAVGILLLITGSRSKVKADAMICYISSFVVIAFSLAIIFFLKVILGGMRIE